MILSSLVNYYETLHSSGNAPDFGWAYVDVYLGLLLDEKGQLLNLIPLTVMEQRGKKQVERGYKLIAPVPVVRTSGANPDFLYGNSSYLFGIESKGVLNKKNFCAAQEYHLRLFSSRNVPCAKAICMFFETWDVEKAETHPLIVREMKTLEQGRNLVFMMDESQFATDDQEIQKIWNEYFQSQFSAGKQLCLVSGKRESIARIHGKIKNIPGAQSSGANLISINADAFVSYNLTDTMPGAPIGEYSAFAYVTALNSLLGDRKHRIDLGDTRLVYWANQNGDKAEEAVGMTLMPSSDGTDDHLLKDIFQNIASGLPVEGVSPEEPFYVLGLRPNAARISVALFLVSSFGDIIKNIQRHYDRLEIISPSYDTRSYLTPWAIMQEIVNQNSRDKIPNPQVMMGLMRAILTGLRYPYLLYENVLMRIRAQQDEKKEKKTQQKDEEDVQNRQIKRKISRGRAAIIKACLLQYLPEKERECITVALNTQSTNKPYILGRLFAVLEAAQQSANPEINTTIKDRFFNSACSNPNIAFPQILKLFEAHIKKIKRDKPSYAISYEKQVQDLLSKLDVEGEPFPKSMGLNDQGLFILGYYQQTQARYSKKEEE